MFDCFREEADALYIASFGALFQPKDGKDCFEIESKGNKIILRGNNGVSVASALYHYLKYYCNAHISWNGDNLNLPSRLPEVPEKIIRPTAFDHRVYLNVE